MAKYYIEESSDLGQRLLDLSAIAGTLIENDMDGGVTKTRIMNDLNDIVQTAKHLRNAIKHGFYDMTPYKAMKEVE